MRDGKARRKPPARRDRNAGVRSAGAGAPQPLVMYRSTKGASKARRDQINAEIRNLKELLPLAEADKVRLSYLHIMSLACIYTRKGVFFAGGEHTGAAGDPSWWAAGTVELREPARTAVCLGQPVGELGGEETWRTEGFLLFLLSSV